MSHDLELLRASSNNKSAVFFKFTSELGFMFSKLFLLCLLNQARACDSQMLSELNIFLLSSQLLKILLNSVDQVLSDGRFRIGPMLANSAIGLCMAKVQLRQNLIS
jgi:hypothetical protein